MEKVWKAGSGNGSGGTLGLPRFENAVFKARFPFANIKLSDKELPVSVELNAWSPFIPTYEHNSSLPLGVMDYTITNKSAKTIDAVFSYNAANFLRVNNGKNYISAYTNGFILSEDGTKDRPFLKVILQFFLMMIIPLLIIAGFVVAGSILLPWPGTL